MDTKRKIYLIKNYKYYYGYVVPRLEIPLLKDILLEHLEEFIHDGCVDMMEDLVSIELNGPPVVEGETIYYSTQYASENIRFYKTEQEALDDEENFRELFIDETDVDEVEELWCRSYIAQPIKVGEFFGNEETGTIERQ